MYPDYGDLRGAWAQAAADLTSPQSITVRLHATRLKLKLEKVYLFLHPKGPPE